MGFTNALNAISRPILLICLFFFLLSCNSSNTTYKRINGNVFGTTFHIQYSDNLKRDIEGDIALLFEKINNSLSTYHSQSTITQLNNGLLSAEVDHHFTSVFNLAKQVYIDTDGYFDPTVGKVVNYWGFGSQKIDDTSVQYLKDSLLPNVGFDKVTLTNSEVYKQRKEIYLEFNAIAKGYGVDVVADFFESNHVDSYLIEIGGEIRTKGLSSKKKFWSVGIEEPNFDGSRSIQKIVALNNEAIATSGNYRKYKIDAISGEKIAHTINPKTGFPAKTDLLSASVITTNTCGEADAYATAFMAMGFEKAKQVALKHPEMKVFFIYLDANNELKTYASEQLVFIK